MTEITKQDVARALYWAINNKGKEGVHFTHGFVIGPYGSGKTALVKALKKVTAPYSNVAEGTNIAGTTSTFTPNRLDAYLTKDTHPDLIEIAEEMSGKKGIEVLAMILYDYGGQSHLAIINKALISNLEKLHGQGARIAVLQPREANYEQQYEKAQTQIKEHGNVLPSAFYLAGADREDFAGELLEGMLKDNTLFADTPIVKGNSLQPEKTLFELVGYTI